jgi:hypothetical protein
MNNDQIVKLFLNGEVKYTDIEKQSLEINFGFKLVQFSKSRFDTRLSQTKKNWVLSKELGWGGSLSDDFPNRWDITSDASIVCYRNNFVEFTFFELVKISLDEKFKIEKEIVIKEAEKVIKSNIVDTLTKVLVQEMMPFSKVSSGYLETNFGIHLKQTQRGMHMNMRYKPRYGNINWVANQVLCWGSNTGWDITTDGKIACCRINYDDYVNFEIEVLTPDQIKEYKKNDPNKADDSFKKLQVLKKMLDAGLISCKEYALKKEELLKSYN